MRTSNAWLFLLISLSFLLVCGCSGDDDDPVFHDYDVIIDGDLDVVDHWDPGDDPGDNGNCGSGYGYGEDCTPVEGNIDCDQDPCVYGSCVRDTGEDYCRCDTGYSGVLCDSCADGYHTENLRCVPNR